MMAAVSEENLDGLRIGMPVTIRVRAYPDVTFGGQVVQLGPQLDPATRTLRRPESSRSSSMQAHNCRFDYQLLPSIKAHLHSRARRSSGFIEAIKAFGGQSLHEH